MLEPLRRGGASVQTNTNAGVWLGRAWPLAMASSDTAKRRKPKWRVFYRNPDFTIRDFFRRDVLLERQEDRDLLYEGLSKAGLPEWKGRANSHRTLAGTGGGPPLPSCKNISTVYFFIHANAEGDGRVCRMAQSAAGSRRQSRATGHGAATTLGVWLAWRCKGAEGRYLRSPHTRWPGASNLFCLAR